MNDYERIASVIRYLDDCQAEQPDLETLAAQVGLSPFHFHRLFSTWAGVTPKEFLQCLTLTHARELLRQGESVLSSALETGLSGPGRLHELCVNLEAASPGEIKSGGAGWTIVRGFAESPFGRCLVGESPRGICHFSFVEGGDHDHAQRSIETDWPRASFRQDDQVAERIVRTVFERSPTSAGRGALRAFVRGTAFQVRVWRSLMRIPEGSLATYGRLAASLGQPTAARAVGTAVGHNPVAVLIPCHRVIRETGVVGGYRWGSTRKRALLAWEGARRQRLPPK